ncbi:hypothetical protein QJS10_CPB17g00598 [Acorus calamus]|uniref:Uncharacterized protein n=1 Tax=Acorus calamus TaxID=4465 RepID=A0AAV9CRF8_ACOCL|nr:hypothetical protein QJS10_CPB17g00598 [Acorus calamus]
MLRYQLPITGHLAPQGRAATRGGSKKLFLGLRVRWLWRWRWWRTGGKKSKVAERDVEENNDHVDGDLVLSIEKLQEIQDELEKDE